MLHPIQGGEARAACEQLAATVAPPKAVRERLLESVGFATGTTRVPTAFEDGPGILTLRAQGSEWIESGVPGCRFRRLFVDRLSKRQTLLFQLDPGAKYPDHYHDGIEECYVVLGNLHIAGTFLRTGDDQRALPGTDPGNSFTVGGCLLLITAAA